MSNTKLEVWLIDHPHPDLLHIRKCYRGHILGSKKKFVTARSLIHYRKFIETYLWTKRKVPN